MKKLLIVLFLVLASAVHAQVRVFAFNGHYFTDMVLRLDNGRTLPPYSYSLADAYYTVAGNRIMAGGMGSEFDLAYTYRDGRLYRGDGFYTSQIAYTFSQGRIYRGDSTFPLDILYNVQNDVIHAGANSFSTDALYLIEGRYSPPQLFAIMLSLELLTP